MPLVVASKLPQQLQAEGEDSIAGIKTRTISEMTEGQILEDGKPTTASGDPRRVSQTTTEGNSSSDSPGYNKQQITFSLQNQAR